ncbi:MAG TPA: M10 family metallopeptidase C-terminal domain-containing protein, partial [Allosphingosinicella sp.]
MPKFGQNLFTSRRFLDSDSASFGLDSFTRLAGASNAAIRQMQLALDGAATSFNAGNSGRPDNYEPVESAWDIPGPNALVDGYTAAPNTTGTLVVDGSHVLAASDTPGDKDWFKVTLTAGQIYQFGQYARTGGIPGVEGNGVPLADAYLEIYDSAGNLLSIADGGGPNTPSGLDALMTFEATYTGTYYVNATSYDNTGDGVGDFVGDYEIFAKTATGTVYSTHYDITNPLHSIDWGGVLVNREHVSVRNPDGMEGPRPTGEPAANPSTVEGNALGYPGKNVIYLYFAGEGDVYANVNSTIPAQVTAQNPYQYEIRAMLTAAAEFSKVADVVFISNYTLNPTTNLYERDPTIEYKPGPLGPEANMKYATGVDGDGFDADFFYWSYPGTPGPGISLLGSMNPPDYNDEGVAQFNSADERWNAQMLQKGGFSFVTLIHEFGHGMGLAHPHDTGGGSSVMQGVVTNGVPGDDGGAGAYDLNQGVHTMMSYNDGWEKSPYGQAQTNNQGFGWLGSLMALDIAVIQDKYGVNEDWATGNDTYVLKDANEAGVYIDSATGQRAEHGPDDATTARDGYYVGESTFYSSIWDAGGVDQITYSGARDTTIDLRPATLRYEYGGGGWMSYAFGIHGGFTIANGVTIENASSGSGNDKLTGNAADNRLEGNDGNDLLYLWFGGGNDTALGGNGTDTIFFGATLNSSDIVNGGGGTDTLVVQGAYGTLTLTSNVTEIEGISLLAGSNTTFGEPGSNRYDYNIVTHDANFAAGVQAFINGGNLLADEDLTFNGSAETDARFVVYGGRGKDTLTGGLGNDIFFFEQDRFSTGDTVNGGAGYDGMFLKGNYTIDFN